MSRAGTVSSVLTNAQVVIAARLTYWSIASPGAFDERIWLARADFGHALSSVRELPGRHVA